MGFTRVANAAGHGDGMKEMLAKMGVVSGGALDHVTLAAARAANASPPPSIVPPDLGASRTPPSNAATLAHAVILSRGVSVTAAEAVAIFRAVVMELSR